MLLLLLCNARTLWAMEGDGEGVAGEASYRGVEGSVGGECRGFGRQDDKGIGTEGC